MLRPVFIAAGVLALAGSTRAEDAPKTYGAPPRLLIASGIDAHGNLVLSGTEQRQKKVPRTVEKDGRKVTQEVSVTYTVAVLERQTVALQGATITDGAGKTLSLAEARERLREPTPVLLALVGEKVDPIYQKILSKDVLTFSFAGIPEFKQLPRASAAAGTSGPPKAKGALAVGQKVPDLALKTLDGKAIKLSELQKDAKRSADGVVVLTFWCSTCSSCRRVEHELDSLARRYRGKAAVIALDANAGEQPDKVAAFAKEMGLELPIVLDPGGRTPDLFGTEVTTTTVVIDGKGMLRYCGRFSDGERAGFAEDALKAVLAGREVAQKTTPHEG